MDEISLYAANPDDSVYVLGVVGPVGCGKSLFSRNIL